MTEPSVRPTHAAPAFCGRERELHRLLGVWETVSREAAGPRVAVLLAESGLGKTRLAQEFFGRLARGAGATGSQGYWPDTLGRDGNNLLVNPPEGGCDAGAELPFLWWGLRLVDPLGHNHLAAGVLSAHVERDLAPHLEPMYRAQRQRQRLGQLAKLGGGLAADAVTDLIPFLGLVKTIGETGLELKELHGAWRRDREALDSGAAAAERRLSLADRVVGDLGALFSGKGTAQVPGVILIDDAQFSPHDPGVVAFVEALLAAMIDGDWPLLLLVTHWEREWAEQTRDAAPSVARALHVFAAENRERLEILRLAPIEDLEPLLRQSLPGLLPHQAQAVLARADGNPRFLDEILRIATSVRGRALFVGRDPRGPMTEAGLADLLARSVALHDLIAERLAASPEPVQKAVALASMQGSEFLRRLVGDTATVLHEPAGDIGGALAAARSPHAYVADVSNGVAAFAQRIYQEAARELLPAWFDPDEAWDALRDVVRRMAVSAEDAVALNDREMAHYCALAAELFETCDDVQDRRIGAFALSRLADDAEAHGDEHGALALARRLAHVLDGLPDDLLDGDLYWLRQTNRILAEWPEREARRPILVRLLKMTKETHEDEPTAWSGWMNALALVMSGDFLGEEGNADGAAGAYAEAWSVMNALAPETLDVDALETFAIVCDRLGVALVERGELDSAAACHEQSIRITGRLREIDPGPARLLNLSVGERRMAALATARRDLAGAERHVDQAIALAREAVAQEPDPQSEAVLAVALDTAAKLLTGREAFEAATAPLMEGLAIRQRHRAAADTTERRRSVAASLHQLAINAWMLDDLDLAWTRVGEALDLLRAAAAASGRPDIRRFYVTCLTKACRIAIERRQIAEAGPLAEEALSLARDDAGTAGPAAQTLLEALCVALPHVAGRDGPEAALPLLAEADAVFAAMPERIRWAAFATMAEIEEIRAKVLERRGDSSGAEVARRRAADLFAAVQPAPDPPMDSGGAARASRRTD